MSIINRWITSVEAVKSLALSAKTAEKARVQTILEQANKDFHSIYNEYSLSLLSNNSQSSSCEANAEVQAALAEAALATSNFKIARMLVERYLQMSSQKDQFFCRSKLVLGMIIKYENKFAKGGDNIKYSKEALSHVMQAIDACLAPDNLIRYKFQLYNSSITAWRIIHNFIRPTRAKFFADSVLKLCTALEQANDPDKIWRIMLFSAAAICYDDDKKVKESSDCLDKAIALADELLQFSLSAERIIKQEASQAITETDELLAAIRKWSEYDDAIRNPRVKINPDADEGFQEEKVPPPEPLTGLAAQGYDYIKAKLDVAQTFKATAEEKLSKNDEIKNSHQERLTRLYLQRIQANTADSKNIVSKPQVLGSVRTKVMSNLQCIRAGLVGEKDLDATYKAIIKDLTDAPPSFITAETLLDVSRFCWTNNMPDLAKQTKVLAEQQNILTMSVRIKLDTCNALETVHVAKTTHANIATKQRLSSRHAEAYLLNAQLEAIKILERTITMCSGKPAFNDFLEEICIICWNVAYPLLQNHTRLQVHRILSLIATSLEQISSNLVLLRTQVHFELSKCEEQADFVMRSKEEIEKAITRDYGGLDTLPPGKTDLDRNRHLDHIIKPFLNALELRTNVYDTPDNTEDQVILMLQQVKESTNRQFQADMLVKATYKMLEELYPNPDAMNEGKSAISISALSVSQLVIPSVSVEDLGAVVKMPRQGAGVNFAEFTNSLQKQLLIMSTVAKFGHAQKNVKISFQATKFVLSYVWKHDDKFFRGLVDNQIDALFILADSLVEFIAQYKIPNVDATSKIRALGIPAADAPVEVLRAKEIIIEALTKALNFGILLSDVWCIQNAIIYFWNLHIHIFKYSMHAEASPQLFEFMKLAYNTIEQFKTKPEAVNLDPMLQYSFIEALVSIYAAKEQVQAGVDIGMKACSQGTSVYGRIRLCETAVRIVELANANQALAGGKGGGKPMEIPKFDNGFLNLYGALASIDVILEKDMMDKLHPLIQKASDIMTTEVGAYLKSLKMDEVDLQQYHQLVEMQAECWTRMTRAKIIVNDILGAQDTSENCLNLVSSSMMLENDRKVLSPKVWRWLSVCERYFGIAISMLIKDEGQDEVLQNELRLASLRHFYLGCNYGRDAARDELVVHSAMCAWNVAMGLLDDARCRSSVLHLIGQIIVLLKTCRKMPAEIALLSQQFYLAVIHCHAQDQSWDKAIESVSEAFEVVPPELQKPLWKWKVVTVSKKGRSIQDALNKLKEGDVSLQARVFAVLARSSSSPKQQIDSYIKALDVLKEDNGRVEYCLETSQWMASASVNSTKILELLLSALDTVYEHEERVLLIDAAEADEMASISESKSQAPRTGTGALSRKNSIGGKSVSQSQAGSARGGGRAMSAVSGTSTRKSAEDEDSAKISSSVALLDSGVRGLFMIAMLESKSIDRVERLLEGVQMIRRIMEVWSDSVFNAYKNDLFEKLGDEQKLTVSKDSIKQHPDLVLPSSPVELISWAPSELLKTVMPLCEPLSIPCAESFCKIPLTWHYFQWAATELEENSCISYAIFVLQFFRIVLMHVEFPEKNTLLGLIYIKTYRLLNLAGYSQQVIETLKLNSNNATTLSDVIVAIIKSKTPESAIKTTTPGLTENAESETSNLFGLTVTTLTIGNVDTYRVVLGIADELLQLGQISLGKVVYNYLQHYFSSVDNKSAFLESKIRQLDIALKDGKYELVVATILQLASTLESVSDAKLLSRFSNLLIQGYVKIDQLPNALDAGRRSLKVLRSMASLELQKPEKSMSKTSTTSISRDSTSRASTTSIITEISFTAARGFCSTSTVLAEVVFDSAKELLEKGKDCRNLLDDFCGYLDDAIFIAESLLGQQSIVYCDLIALKGTLSFKFVLMFHFNSSRHISENVYTSWLQDECKKALSLMASSQTLLKSLISKLPLLERVVNKDVFCNFISKKLSVVETQYFYQQLIYSYLIRSMYNKSTSTNAEVTPIDRFMQDTESPAIFGRDDFSPSTFLAAAMDAAATNVETEGTIMAVSSNLIFRAADLLRSYITDTVSSESTSSLSSFIGEGITNGCWDAVKVSASTLCDALSKGNEKQASYWIMLLQSVNARSWMESTWRSILNPASDISLMLLNVDNINSQIYATTTLNKFGRPSSTAFNSSSVPIKRLNVSQNVGSIIRSCVPASSIVVTVQLNVSMDTVFVSAGYDLKSAPFDEFTLPGEWCVDKIPLTESNKRLLQTLISQQKKWQDDAAKFSASYSEILPLDADVDGLNLKYSDKTANKTEGSLEERMRALLTDLDSIFAPILGSGSKVAAFLLDAAQKIIGGGAAAAKGGKVFPPSILLLLDQSIQALPFEGLSFGSCVDNRVGRDFSIHMYGHRAASAIPGFAFNNASPGPAVVNSFSTTTKVIVDPYGEDDGFNQQGIQRPSMTVVAASLLSETSQQKVVGAKKWKVLAEVKGTISLQDFIETCEQSSKAKPSSLVFYGPERLGAYVSPREIIGMNFENVSMIFLSDNCRNDTSMRRQNATDNLKAIKDMQNENPLTVAMLLSLSGAGSIASHQWSTTFSAQKRLMETALVSYSSQGLPLNQSISNACEIKDVKDPSKNIKIKKWISLARVFFGLQNVCYSDS